MVNYRCEATRYARKINPRSIKNIHIVFLVIDGIVQEVYRVTDWYLVEVRNRYAFNGEIAENHTREIC